MANTSASATTTVNWSSIASTSSAAKHQNSRRNASKSHRLPSRQPIYVKLDDEIGTLDCESDSTSLYDSMNEAETGLFIRWWFSIGFSFLSQFFKLLRRREIRGRFTFCIQFPSVWHRNSWSVWHSLLWVILLRCCYFFFFQLTFCKFACDIFVARSFPCIHSARARARRWQQNIYIQKKNKQNKFRNHIEYAQSEWNEWKNKTCFNVQFDMTVLLRW